MKTICLTMIVKNESDIIEKCLESVSDYIDYWVICDTGSTDNTQEVIKTYFNRRNIPGKLYETPWKNFGYNRTVVFNKAKMVLDEFNIDYFFVMDADDELMGDLSDFIHDEQYCDEYYMEFRTNNTRFNRKSMFSTKHEWRYEGVLHEYPCSNTTNVTTSTIINCHIKDGRCGNRSSSVNAIEKYLGDAKILLEGIKDEPENKRYYFYLAQSYYDGKDYPNAMKYYKKRAEMGGWDEEVYYSLFMYAKAKYLISSNMDDSVYDFLKAHNYRSTRLEALYLVLEYYCRHDPKKGYCYGMLGYDACLKYPSDILFVNYSIHKYRFMDRLAVCAIRMGHHDLALKLNRNILRIIEDGTIEIDAKRIKRNIQRSLEAQKCIVARDKIIGNI